MPIFGHSKFLPVFLYQKGFNKFRMPIFGLSEFMLIFLGKIVRKNWKCHFWPFIIYTNLFGKIVRKNSECHFWLFQIYTSLFGENCQKKIQNSYFWPFQIHTSLFGKIVRKKFRAAIFCTYHLIECKGLESNDICTFLDFYSET